MQPRVYHKNPIKENPDRHLYLVLEMPTQYLVQCRSGSYMDTRVYAVSKDDFQLNEPTDEGDDLI